VSKASVVACITDFGSSDYYAGALHGVLAARIPGAAVVDVTHGIPAGDIRRAAIMLWEAQPAFPDGTVFLVVVDPGVGSTRRSAAFRFPRCSLVCPDNGIATFLFERFPEFEAVEIDPRRVTDSPISNTFHGRDLFAPAAARLFLEGDLHLLGPALSAPVRLPLPLLQPGENGGWEGEVLYIDHFGNAVTSIGQITYDRRSIRPWLHTDAVPRTLPSDARVVLEDGRRIPLARTYSDAGSIRGTVALVGSNGLLEIASSTAPDGSAAPPRIGRRVCLLPSE
jgi:S-adenosylmethionine hydrolase